MSVHSDNPWSPGLGTPRSMLDYSENSSVALSLSPRSRTSSQVPTSLHSETQDPSAPSSTAPGQRTPLPTKKEATSAKDFWETKQDMEQVTQRTPLIRDERPESHRSSREHSSALPAEASLKRKSLDPQRLSPESSSAGSLPMRSLTTGENHSRYRSPSSAPSFEIVGTDASSGDAPRSTTSTILISDDSVTPPRKRPALDNDRIFLSARQETAPWLYSTFPSNSALPEMGGNKEASTRIMKQRGRKPSNSDTAERRQLNNKTSDASSSDQNSLSKHPKQDNITDDVPHQLQPFDYTPRVNFQNPDISQPQPHANKPLTNQPSTPPIHHHTLPPRPSITPPPGASPQLMEKYRPPAVVFTVDNRAESRMLTTDVKSFIEQFTKNARVIPPATQRSTSQCVYPAGVIMWQNLPDFYKWYTETTGSTAIGPLSFELIDVKWQTKKAYVVPEGDVNHFRSLKQYVWDLFWVASNLNGGPSLFQVSISSHQSHGATISSQPSVWKSINSTHALPRTSGTASLENIMIVPEPRALPGAASSSPRTVGRPLPLSTLAHRTSNIENILNTKEGREVKSRAGRRPRALANNQQSGKSTIESSPNKNRVPRPSDYIHGPPGPPVNANRTSWDKAMLRDRAHGFVSSILCVEMNSVTDNPEARRKERC